MGLEPAEVTLPVLVDATTGGLTQITAALGVPRDVLPPDEQIRAAGAQLPRLLSEIPPTYRTQDHVRMCVAVASGLFDAGINYAWNAAVLRLRDRVRAFGINVVSQFTGKAFSEEELVDLKDAELLDLCVRLNLIAEDAFFFLDQARDTRNNFSSAHPAMGQIDDIEFAAFVNRCTRYALAETEDPRGVDSHAFIDALKAGRFTAPQLEEWDGRLRRTHAPQRDLLFGTLHGIYCDPASQEEVRLNAIDLCRRISPVLSEGAKSRAIDQHSEYIAAGQVDRRRASEQFFEQLGALALLGTAEQHVLFSRALQSLLSVHQGWDNFHHEPPFAERVWALTQQIAVPSSIQEQFVDVVLTCAAGNPFGISWAAAPTYEKIIRNFSPREVRLMLQAADRSTLLSRRLQAYESCRNRFAKLVNTISAESVDPADRPTYERWLQMAR